MQFNDKDGNPVNENGSPIENKNNGGGHDSVSPHRR